MSPVVDHAPVRHRPHPATRLTCLGASLVLLAAAAAGMVTLWDQVPQFPPPAANELLLTLRRMALAALALFGLLTLPWGFRPAVVPLLGAGLHVLALLAAVGATAALRGEAVAPLFWVPAAASAAACLAIVWASVRPASVRS